MKREKEIINKSYIQWDDNYGEMLHRKKEERIRGMGKITKKANTFRPGVGGVELGMI